MRAPSWQTIANMENARWKRFARAHAAESERCAELAALAGPGVEYTKTQVIELAELARVNGWPILQAGTSAKAKRAYRRQ